MRKLFKIIFSAYVWFICFAWMLIICILTFLLLPIFPYKKTHDWIAAPGFAFVLRLIFCPTKITYDPAFDPKRRSVFCQNHVNLLDAFIASKAIPHVFCGLMHRWQFKIPIYGWMMWVSKGIAMEQKQMKDARAYMASEARQRKEDGFSILAFPEGSRTRDGHIHTFKRGIFFMARDAGYPVVPIVVQGNFEINQAKSGFFHPGKINVYVGPHMETQGLSDEAIKELAQKCQHYAEQKLMELKS